MTKDSDRNLLNIQIGKKIAYYRAKRRLTQNELAEKTGLSQKGLSLIENGETFPRSETLMILSNFFKVEVKNFFDFDDMKNREEKVSEIKDLIDFIKEDDLKVQSLLTYLRTLIEL